MADLPFFMLALVSVVLTTCSQLLLKGGIRQVMAALPADVPLAVLATHFALNPLVWGGIATMGCSLVSWIAALTRLEVSRAYPFTALVIVLTVVAGRFLFGEALSGAKIAGAVLIITGMLVVARS